MSWKQNVAAVAATIISAVAAVLFSSAIAATVDPQSLTALGTSSTTIRHHVYEMHCNVQASTLGCLVISGPCFGFDEEGDTALNSIHAANSRPQGSDSTGRNTCWRKCAHSAP